MMEAKPIAIKQLLWDEANTVYELDDPPINTEAKNRPKSGKPTGVKKSAGPIKQP